VAIVDALPYGGTCALRGCDPKKILRRGAEIIDSARLMRGKGIDDAGLSIDWPDLMKHKHGFTDPVPQSMEDGLTDNGVTTLHGQARFIGPRQLEIDGASFDADRFLVATGARPRPLDFPGHEHLIDSTDFLDLEELPSRIFCGRRFHLLRVRPHRRPGRQLTGHRRPRRAPAETTVSRRSSARGCRPGRTVPRRRRPNRC